MVGYKMEGGISKLYNFSPFTSYARAYVDCVKTNFIQ